MFPQTPGPIGLFDSGYGGLTIFDKIHQFVFHIVWTYILVLETKVQKTRHIRFLWRRF